MKTRLTSKEVFERALAMFPTEPNAAKRRLMYRAKQRYTPVTSRMDNSEVNAHLNAHTLPYIYDEDTGDIVDSDTGEVLCSRTLPVGGRHFMADKLRWYMLLGVYPEKKVVRVDPNAPPTASNLRVKQ